MTTVTMQMRAGATLAQVLLEVRRIEFAAPLETGAGDA
jgi:hypothetical protein